MGPSFLPSKNFAKLQIGPLSLGIDPPTSRVADNVYLIGPPSRCEKEYQEGLILLYVTHDSHSIGSRIYYIIGCLKLWNIFDQSWLYFIADSSKSKENMA